MCVVCIGGGAFTMFTLQRRFRLMGSGGMLRVGFFGGLDFPDGEFKSRTTFSESRYLKFVFFYTHIRLLAKLQFSLAALTK